MGEFWAINAVIFLLKASGVASLAGAFTLAVVSAIAGIAGLNELARVGVQVNAEAYVAVVLGQIPFIIGGLISFVIFFAAAQFYSLLVNLMNEALFRLRVMRQIPGQPRKRLFDDEQQRMYAPYRDDRSATVRSPGKWDMGKS
jgi:uncharacterized protein YacL